MYKRINFSYSPLKPRSYGKYKDLDQIIERHEEEESQQRKKLEEEE